MTATEQAAYEDRLRLRINRINQLTKQGACLGRGLPKDKELDLYVRMFRLLPGRTRKTPSRDDRRPRPEAVPPPGAGISVRYASLAGPDRARSTGPDGLHYAAYL